MNQKFEKRRREDAELLCEAIKGYFEKYHYAPTIRELCEEMHLSSTCTVSKRLFIAREMGYIDFSDKEPRTIVLKNYDYILRKREK